MNSTDVEQQPNQNTCPEVMSAINFVWGNPMVNKTTFPIRPIYPEYLAPMVSDGYGIADRVNFSLRIDPQFVAKTYDGFKGNLNLTSENGPTYNAIFTLRVSQSTI